MARTVRFNSCFSLQGHDSSAQVALPAFGPEFWQHEEQPKNLGHDKIGGFHINPRKYIYI